MRAFRLPALAVSALTLASFVTPSFAGSPYYDAMGAPMSADQADMVMHDRMMDTGMMKSGPHAMGRHTCSPMERRTRMQRQACGMAKGM